MSNKVDIDNELKKYMVELFKNMLTKKETSIFFIKRVENIEDIVTLEDDNEKITLYRLYSKEGITRLSNKWRGKRLKLRKQINSYNQKINNPYINQKPIKEDKYVDEYNKIEKSLNKANNFFNRLLLGDMWEKVVVQKPYLFIRYNQISVQLNKKEFSFLLLNSINIHKKRSLKHLNTVLYGVENDDKKYISEKNKFEIGEDIPPFTIDYILDKIAKYGIDSLTQKELEFLKNNSK